MTTNKKPTVTLLGGKKTKDFDSLMLLFKKITGRDPTPEELKEAREEMARP